MGIDFKKVVEEYGTPLYIYNFDGIKKRYLELKEAFQGKKSLIAYAVKANSNLSLIKELADIGSGADCVSIGEIQKGFDCWCRTLYKIIFSGGLGKEMMEV